MTEKHIGVERKGYNFGTSAVFLTSICGILCAVMFLRFGYAIGNVGLIGALIIILIGHLITIPTAIAISEIATNLRLGGGGEYYIISRSFGQQIGSTIGVMLYAAQAASVAFYIIGFAEGFQVWEPWIQSHLLDHISFIHVEYDPRLISIPAALIMFSIILIKGADIGIKLLWIVFGMIVVGVIVFIISPPLGLGEPSGITESVPNSIPFLTMFAIVFPAMTGMTAGVGLSGDLKNPARSIPRGVILATLLGLVVYIMVLIKLYLSAPVDLLASDQLIMYRIANGFHGVKLGWIILIGLFGATISSALGFAMVAPRTLQSLGRDRTFFSRRITRFLKYGRGKENEPVNGILVSGIITVVFILLGDLNVVAQIVTVFFLITYGSVCLISFLEHFAGNPSYRPTFKSKWYISLIGALFSFGIMIQFSLLYAFIAFAIMALIYLAMGRKHRGSRSFAIIFQGVMFQVSRLIKINLQRTMSKPDKFNWRPSILTVTTNAIERKGSKDMLRWISHHYGFGTLVHLIKGKLDGETVERSKRDEKVLIKEMNETKAHYSVTTLVSPSTVTAVAQTVQLTGISGMDNNTIMFEFNESQGDEVPDILSGLKVAGSVNYNKLVLRSTEHNFGLRKIIHLWITKDDLKNINLMILLSYIIMQHKDWKDAQITIFTLFSKGDKDFQARSVKALISTGRIPIPMKSIKPEIIRSERDMVDKINRISKRADLTIIGFTRKDVHSLGSVTFTRYEKIRDTLFVSASQDIVIS
jgi:solute carrier family 12 sodium/potassium/chloride transporter 2